ncbi:hypothetical protein GCM10011380_05490 [Sphingomonas metalli]|uniref:Uncharacterized protein n=1 Tax=Sphingomonas metalli TaxID=1779358 RepID=A0A916SXV1_9SPHN|nr:hypothetical protein [Sphingomonas metalli]GGB18834.1 hypothetical protein GCM10011380_05490 [Sphingomonas metalli]
MVSDALPRPVDADPWAGWLRRMALFQLAALAIVTAFILGKGNDDLPYYYFLTQDLPLLAAGGLALFGFARVRHVRGVAGLTRGRAAALAVGAGLLAYAGSWLVLHRYAVSRDEQMADFAAAYLASGHMGQAIPPDLIPLAKAMMPVFTNVYPATGYWVSDYLPGNSAIRAIAMLTGDSWLASPVLLAIGLLALWSAARRIWPERPEAATVALVLAATSTQALVTAMSPFAMTAHLAINALWLACFVRQERRWHWAAAGLTVVAIGLHQVHFHLIFLSGFLIATALRRDWRMLAILLTGAVAGYIVWQIGWRDLIPRLFDPVQAAQATGQVAERAAGEITGRLVRILRQDMLRHLARFVAWQNVLLAPLAAIGIVAAWRTAHPALRGGAISCAIALLVLPEQEHGFGYRYLHGMIGPFCLLAAQGWLALEAKRGRPLPRAALWGSTAFALVVTLPYASWRSMAYAAPYEAAYRAVRAVDADVVLIDTSHQTYISDIVRFDPAAGPSQRPVLADLAYVPADALARLCATRSVVVVTDRDLQRFDLPPFGYAFDKRRPTNARLAEMRRMGCGRPLPRG